MVAETKDYTQEEVVNKLKEYIAKFPTRGEAADALNVGRVFLWRVLEGKANPTPAILRELGFTRERHIFYTYKAVSDAK
jgi:hypothetical protein